MQADEFSFPDLYAGRTDSLMIAVSVRLTAATRESPINGVWRLTRAQFLVILENLQSTEQFKEFSLEQIAESCDVVGIENRFFRLNPVVGAWIDGTEPEVLVNYTLA